MPGNMTKLEDEAQGELNPSQAIAFQKRLAEKVVRKSKLNRLSTVAGVDCAYRKGIIKAAVVVMSYPELETTVETVAELPVTFPYIPGLLSFREGPAVIKALSRLERLPDLLIFDGHGIAHPRRFGIASHIGLLTDIPSIGCAKTKLLGHYREPSSRRGGFSYLNDKGEAIGAAVRTRTNVKPVFVSIGHGVSLKDSIDNVLNCCCGYRLPETTRRADCLASF
jgi:deoxyribonuclease V